MPLRRLFFLVTVLAATYVGWVFVSRALASQHWARSHARPAPANAEFDRIYGGRDVKILQFYARESTSPKAVNR
jgi:hypothetical protein